MGVIPDREGCLALLREAGCRSGVIEHVQAVERLASRMAAQSEQIDEAVVQAGALLHDIGRSREQGPEHVPIGVALLEEAGVDERVVACVARHMGAGIEAEQAKAWGWPGDRTYVPDRVEEMVVAHADNLTFGTEYVDGARAAEDLDKQGLAKAADRVRKLHDALGAVLGVDPDAVAAKLREEAFEER